MAEFASRWLLPEPAETRSEGGDESDRSPSVPDASEEPPPPTTEHEAWAAWDLAVAETVANVLAASAADKRGWHREVVAALRCLEAGQPADERWRADLAHDVAVLRRILGTGRCLGCGKPAVEGGHWCAACSARPAEGMEATG